jgi:hypothetical protein
MTSRSFFIVLLLASMAPAQQWHPPTQTKKLSHGLVVVVSEDHSAPTIGICVTYGIGFRLEPEGRTGFAHLFEHMMFEGTPVSRACLTRSPNRGRLCQWRHRYDYAGHRAHRPPPSSLLWLKADA